MKSLYYLLLPCKVILRKDFLKFKYKGVLRQEYSSKILSNRTVTMHGGICMSLQSLGTNIELILYYEIEL